MNEKMKKYQKIINFYVAKKSHYPITDLFCMNFKQKEGGYVKVYEDLSNEKKSPDNAEFFEIIRNNQELMEPLKWLEKLDEKEKKCYIDEKYQQLEPNQKWHFLISWMAFKIVVETNPLKNPTRVTKLPDNVKQFCGVNCPELRLWLFEAAMDNDIVKIQDVYEMYSKLVDGRREKDIRTYYSKECEYWSECWKKILSVIDKAYGELD